MSYRNAYQVYQIIAFFMLLADSWKNLITDWLLWITARVQICPVIINELQCKTSHTKDYETYELSPYRPRSLLVILPTSTIQQISDRLLWVTLPVMFASNVNKYAPQVGSLLACLKIQRVRWSCPLSQLISTGLSIQYNFSLT